MKITPKACPVVLRRAHSRLEILAFQHPVAGYQLVKGSIEIDEEPEAAAIRELSEEAGIETSVDKAIGILKMPHLHQSWYLFLMTTPNGLPEFWDHQVTDGGGHTFSFFWCDLDDDFRAHPKWDERYVMVLDRVKDFLISEVWP